MWIQNNAGLTSNQELLTFDLGVSFGLLQEADPVVHLLRQLRVTVDHSIRRDDHERVRPAGYKRGFNYYQSEILTNYNG